MKRSSTWALVAVSALACGPGDDASRPASTPPRTAPAASPSPPAAEPVRDEAQIEKMFPAAGISRVILRAGMAGQARITSNSRHLISVAGTPRGGAAGYHPSDPKWRPTPAEAWGLEFRGKPFGKTLVISTFNEIHYIHHSYYLDGLVISVPPGTEVTLEARQLSGAGAPDLAEPSPSPPGPPTSR